MTEYAEQGPGQKPHFTDFQFNPFPLGYTALNECHTKGSLKYERMLRMIHGVGVGELKFPEGQSLSP